MMVIPTVRVCRQAIFQKKTPPEMLGRVFSIQRAIQRAALPLSAVVSGALADVFEPYLIDRHAPLANSIGAVVGVGKGRGIALIFILLGVGLLTASVAAYCYEPLRCIELHLPDCKPLSVVDDDGASAKAKQR